MNRIDNVVQAVTYRLAADPELRMDIAKEVRAHLEDAIEAARAAGESDEESVASALKSFGDTDEVGREIWRANRSRMRLRAIVKWLLRLTLVPAAVILTFYLCHGPLLVGGFLSNMFDTGTNLADELGLGLQPARLRPIAGLTEEERFVFEHRSQRIEDAEAIVEEYPGNPLYWGNYTTAFLHFKLKDTSGKKIGPALLEEFMTICDRGVEIEPDNAFYDYLKASVLMEQSSTLLEGEGVKYEYVDHRGESRESRGDGLRIDDPVMFERGLQAYREGISKPYSTSHVLDFMEYRSKLTRCPENLMEQIQQIAIWTGALLPHFSYMRDVTRRPLAHAVNLASEGETEQATRLLEDIERPGIQMGSNERTLIGLLVARAMIHMAKFQTPVIYERVGMKAQAETARAEAEMENEVWNSLWRRESAYHSPEYVKKHYGAMMGLLTPALPNLDPINVVPMRTIEHLWVERAFLAVTALALCFTLFLAGGWTLWSLWRYRKSAEGPKLFFVGYERVGWIVLLALVLPVGLYFAYTRLMPFSSFQYGVDYAIGRVTVELAVIVSLTLGLIISMGYRSIRGRCRDAGMRVPESGAFNPFRSWPASLFIVLPVALAMFYFISWHLKDGEGRLLGWTLGAAGAVVAVVIGLACLGWFVFETIRLRRRGAEVAHFHRTLYRSLVPILASCLVAVGLLSNAYLNFTERGLMREMNQPGRRFFLDELEMTSLKEYRTHLQQLAKDWKQTPR